MVSKYQLPTDYRLLVIFYKYDQNSIQLLLWFIYAAGSLLKYKALISEHKNNV